MKEASFRQMWRRVANSGRLLSQVYEMLGHRWPILGDICIPVQAEWHGMIASVPAQPYHRPGTAHVTCAHTQLVSMDKYLIVPGPEHTNGSRRDVARAHYDSSQLGTHDHTHTSTPPRRVCASCVCDVLLEGLNTQSHRPSCHVHGAPRQRHHAHQLQSPQASAPSSRLSGAPPAPRPRKKGVRRPAAAGRRRRPARAAELAGHLRPELAAVVHRGAARSGGTWGALGGPPWAGARPRRPSSAGGPTR